jgi:RNA polymerase sigma factor (sigma-70 family)
MLTTKEEKELVTGCLRGDNASQKKLFEIFSAKMYAVCLRYASEYNLAQDFLQDGFVRVYSKLHQFRFEGPLEGWMRRIFVHTAIEHFRKQKMQLEEISEEAYQLKDSYNETLSKLNMQDLLTLISKLPNGYRTVFNMYVLEGYSHMEIAANLGISESTSKTQLRKARLLLIEKLNTLNQKSL